jgi:pyrophosphatase PpaX
LNYPFVLFDLDGTLINTNDLILASFMHTLEHHCPGKYTEEDVLKCMGEPLSDQMNRFDPTQAEEMVKTYHSFNVAKHDEYTKEFPHVREVLQQLHQAGVKMGVVTNKRRLVVEMGLKLFGLEQWMDVIVCFGDSPEIKGKPEPDLLFVALEKLKAPAEQTLMVGDSRYDIIAARRAHVPSVGVGWSLNRDQLKEYQADFFIEDMREILPIVGILNQVESG